MKICPKCDESFSDDDLNFCLMDGTPLLAGESQPTVAIRGSGAETEVMPQAPETASVKKKSSAAIWIVLAVSSLTLLVVTIVAGGFLLYFYTGSDENAGGSRKGTVPAATTPRVAATPRSAPSPANSPAPEPTPSATTNGDPDADELEGITPVAWDTAAFLFTGEDGKVYEFECPENGTASAVWGDAAYTEDSSICTAAVHSGVITLEDGGYVVIQFRPGRETYGSSTRNGITTLSFGKDERSFVIGKKVGGH